MKNITTIFLCILSALSVYGQTEKVKGSIASSDTADLAVLNIYPDSFPHVSVLFKAQTRKGEPVWNLTKEKMIAKENSQICEVVSLEQISKNKPINIGIVIDHSGSMLYDYKQLYDQNRMPLFSFDKDYVLKLPIGYKPPIENAKSAVKHFVSSFNSKKDFVSIIGFSTKVDKILLLTQNVKEINSIVDGMQADSSTALYDAMLAGINQLNKSKGVKVLVVLTDGMDNSSKYKWDDVVALANGQEIPIYIIGLGDVYVDTLQMITNATKGQFYNIQSGNLLDSIYAAISIQVQAFYNLVYISPNFSSADSTRQIELSFDIDKIYLVTNPSILHFPKEVLEFIASKEKEKQYLLYGGLALVVLISAGTILYRIQRKKKISPTIIRKVYPNPTTGTINLDYKSGIGKLQIVNLNGQIVKSINLTGIETQFDLTDLQNGNYIAMIYSDGGQSNGMKFIIQQ